MSQPATNPYPFQTASRLWAYGRWGKGGTVVIEDGDLQATVELSAALFDVLAILILAAQRAKGFESWVPAGFVSVEGLRHEMTRRAGGTLSLPLADPENVIKAICRIRKRLGQALFPKGGGASFAKQLLETTNLGYRLSTDPGALHLVILGELESAPDAIVD